MNTTTKNHPNPTQTPPTYHINYAKGQKFLLQTLFKCVVVMGTMKQCCSLYIQRLQVVRWVSAEALLDKRLREDGTGEATSHGAVVGAVTRGLRPSVCGGAGLLL